MPAPVANLLAAGLLVAGLLAAPVPILPPHGLAELVQSTLGVGWKPAYLVTALGLQAAFYLAMGLLAALVLPPASSTQGRLLQVFLVPLAVVGIALVIRSVKAGHLPLLANAVVPIIACVIGTWLGLGLLHRSWHVTLGVGVLLAGAALLGWRASPSSALTRDTEASLRHLAQLPPAGSDSARRFSELLQGAFAGAGGRTPVEQNRAALVALGIAVGDARLARLVGLDRDTALLGQAVQAGEGATLLGRGDWARHFTLSAALAVLHHPLVSDAAGLVKEQVDALARGTGFSFGDLAADRAGIRFARAATASDQAAVATRARLASGFVVGDFFPDVDGLPPDLTEAEFRRDFERAGSPSFRAMVAEIDARLDRCPGLAIP